MQRLACGAAVSLVLIATTAGRAQAEEMIVDNTAPSVQVTGAWARSRATPAFFGPDYLFHVSGDPASVLWPFPERGIPGQYAVFARWTAGPNRSAGVAYQVMREGGVASVVVDQRDRGGTWQLLAVCAFQPGHGQGVSVAGGADGVVVADAIRFVGPTTSDLTTSSGTARPHRADATQQAVDSGHDPWRLDPLHVAHAEWGMLGFAETDPLELASQGPGVAVVHAVSRGARYQMRLVQPVRLGPTGIWTVESVYHLANL